MQAHHTTDLEFSSLPTPKARDAQAEGYQAGLRRATPQVGTIVKALVEGDQRIFFPTPAVSDNRGAAKSEVEAGDPKHRLKVAVELLPTTRAQNGEDRNNKIYARDPKQPQNLENALAITLLPTTRTSMKNGATQKEIDAGNPKFRIEAVTNWGKFEPAIKRWEQVIGRKAPAPTKPDGKDGSHRLSSAFTEWMMGVPEGWITDCGLSRNDELKACGNGVVPQQAELALRLLLDGVELERGQAANNDLPS